MQIRCVSVYEYPTNPAMPGARGPRGPKEAARKGESIFFTARPCSFWVLYGVALFEELVATILCAGPVMPAYFLLVNDILILRSAL